MSISTIAIVLELDGTTDCPSGNAAAEGCEPQAFHGWLGLAAAIDALMRSSDEQARERAATHTSLTEGETP